MTHQLTQDFQDGGARPKANRRATGVGRRASRASNPSGFPLPAPSLRIPVTRENRDLLRVLRAAELVAWDPEAAVTLHEKA